MKTETRHIILCDGAVIPNSFSGNMPEKDNHIISLVNREGSGKQNMTVKIHDFATHLMPKMPERTRDLIEIAAFIYAADRMIKRGTTDQLEYSGWARDLTFCIPVRDLTFWQQSVVSEHLTKALTFMSGDKAYQFYFTQRTGVDQITSLLHSAEAVKNLTDANQIYPVALFSGGLDSLAGIISLLENTSQKIVVTSHRSNTSTTQVQNRVYDALEKAYPERLLYHPLECNLKGIRASEETQRTRFFLYTAVGFALAQHSHTAVVK